METAVEIAVLTGAAMEKFKEFDIDGNGTLDEAEIMALAEWSWCSFRPGKNITSKDRIQEAAKILKRCDANGDGVIDRNEFKTYYERTASAISKFNAAQPSKVEVPSVVGVAENMTPEEEQSLLRSVEMEVLSGAANDKWNELDMDGNGLLEGEEIEELAEWVWCSFRPGKTIDPDTRKDEAAKIFSRCNNGKDEKVIKKAQFKDYYEHIAESMVKFKASAAKRAAKQAIKTEEPSAAEMYATYANDARSHGRAVDVEHSEERNDSSANAADSSATAADVMENYLHNDINTRVTQQGLVDATQDVYEASGAYVAHAEAHYTLMNAMNEDENEISEKVRSSERKSTELEMRLTIAKAEFEEAKIQEAKLQVRKAKSEVEKKAINLNPNPPNHEAINLTVLDSKREAKRLQFHITHTTLDKVNILAELTRAEKEVRSEADEEEEIAQKEHEMAKGFSAMADLQSQIARLKAGEYPVKLKPDTRELLESLEEFEEMEEDDFQESSSSKLLGAALEGDADAAFRLLNREDAEVNYQGGKRGFTPLYVAAQQGNKQLVELFISSKADVNRCLKGVGGATPLLIAARDTHKEVVFTLLGAGANPHLRPARLYKYDRHVKAKAPFKPRKITTDRAAPHVDVKTRLSLVAGPRSNGKASVGSRPRSNSKGSVGSRPRSNSKDSVGSKDSTVSQIRIISPRGTTPRETRSL